MERSIESTAKAYELLIAQIRAGKAVLISEEDLGIDPELPQIIMSSNERSLAYIQDMVFGKVEVGDVISLDRESVIERKQVDDFCKSCSSPHMWDQVRAMRMNYKHRYIIIVGHFPEDVSWRNKQNIRHAYRSLGLLARMGINVINVKDDNMFSGLAEEIMKVSEKRDPSTPIKRVQKDGKLSVLCAIEGVGENKAKALLEKFKTIAALSNASVEQISEVKVGRNRIGDTIATRIKTTLFE